MEPSENNQKEAQQPEKGDEKEQETDPDVLNEEFRQKRGETLDTVDLNELKKEVTYKDAVRKAKYLTGKKMNEDGQTNKVFLFCITGGPCAGKTTCLQFLSERFAPQYKVFIVPELATMTVQAGVAIIPSEFTPETHKVFTKGIMKAQMDLENYYYDLARIQKKDVIIFTDRGMMDNTAYCTKEVTEKVFGETGWNVQKLTNQRYDAVFHLVTAADGAEQYYTCENNEARSEGVEVARMLDKWTQNAWVEHAHHFVVDNSIPGFNLKMQRLYGLITRFLNVPETVHFTKKYLCPEGFDTAWLPEGVKFANFYEEFDFLTCNEENKRMWIKKRTDPDGNNSYSIVTRTMAEKEDHRLELKRKINARIYNEYQWQKDDSMITLKKNFTVFNWENITYMVETYILEGENITVCRINIDNEELLEKCKPPSFMKSTDDISLDPKYFMYNISKKK